MAKRIAEAQFPSMEFAAKASYKCQSARRSAWQRVEDNAFHLYDAA